MLWPSQATTTIAAIATAAGRGALGILRLSGPQAFAIAARIAGALPPPRQAGLRRFRDDQGRALDQGLVLCFPGPASFTGEDVVELQAHGGAVLLAELLTIALAAGARSARPGEFSERAFLNGRIDLAQAEAVADLIDAVSVAAVRAAQNTLAGAFSAQVHAVVDELIRLRVLLEGALDFSDQDIDWLGEARCLERLQALVASVQHTRSQAQQGRRLREGMSVVIVGAPNVGKSTLLNALAGQDAAIVTDRPGTTRDILREHILLDGLPLTVVDTAGLRETEDPVEREGIRRARAVLEKAELALFLVDDEAGITAADEALLAGLPPLPRLLIRNKCDRSGQPAASWLEHGTSTLRLSAKSGAGMGLLAEAIKAQAGFAAQAEGQFLARARHLEALARAAQHLDLALGLVAAGSHLELAAEELRLAQNQLSTITGEFGVEALLGEIFSRFCIGK